MRTAYIIGAAPEGETPESDTVNSLITIQKAKVTKGRLYCEFTEKRPTSSDEEEAPVRSLTVLCGEQVHPDLLTAFAQLVPHLCLLTEQLPDEEDFFPEPDEEVAAYGRFAPYTVTGFSNGENGGVTLVGQRRLQSKRILNLTTPYVAFDDENFTYDHLDRLSEALNVAEHEVELALRGKSAPLAPKAVDPQLALPFDGDPAGAVDIIEATLAHRAAVLPGYVENAQAIADRTGDPHDQAVADLYQQELTRLSNASPASQKRTAALDQDILDSQTGGKKKKAPKLQNPFQEMADQHGLTISTGLPGGKMHVIAAPQKDHKRRAAGDND